MNEIYQQPNNTIDPKYLEELRERMRMAEFISDKLSKDVNWQVEAIQIVLANSRTSLSARKMRIINSHLQAIREMVSSAKPFPVPDTSAQSA